MLEAKLKNDADYQALIAAGGNGKRDFDRAIVKLIALRTVNDVAGSRILERDQEVQGTGGIIGGYLNINAGGKVLTNGAGGIPTRLLLDYLTEQIKAGNDAFNTINMLSLNAGNGATVQDKPVLAAFGKLVALEVDALDA